MPRNIFSFQIGAYLVFDGLISSFGRVNPFNFRGGVTDLDTTAAVDMTVLEHFCTKTRQKLLT